MKCRSTNQNSKDQFLSDKIQFRDIAVPSDYQGKVEEKFLNLISGMKAGKYEENF